MKPLVSIIVSVLNAEETIQRCIDSIAKQTYPQKELIVIDGDSTDSTIDILQANDIVIDYWSSEKDYGIYNAWNKALDHSNGEWICFLGADDYLYSPDVLERAVCELDKVPANYKLAYGRIRIVNKKGQVIMEKGEPWEVFKTRSSFPIGIPHQGVFHRRNLFKEYGLFDESFQIAGDNDLLLRVLQSEEPYFIEDLIIAAMEYYGKSSNPQNKLLMLKEFYVARRNNGFRSLSLQWGIEYIWSLFIRFLFKIAGSKGVRCFIKICCKLTNQPPYWEKY